MKVLSLFTLTIQNPYLLSKTPMLLFFSVEDFKKLHIDLFLKTIYIPI